MRILFICKNNHFRSQMAAALYNKLTASNDAHSAGTFVGHETNPEGSRIEQHFEKPDFFELMEEHGMHIRDNRAKALTPELLETADIAVSFAQEPFIPPFLKEAADVIWWEVEDPKKVTRQVAEKTFLEIEKKVRGLLG